MSQLFSHLRGRLAGISRAVIPPVVIILITLAILDVALIATGLFPPPYNPGDELVGWVAAQPSGSMVEARCFDPSKREVLSFARNDVALRTDLSSEELIASEHLFLIGVGGDSHTELCAANEDTHFGVMAEEMNARGVEARAFAYGAGKYSPLQAYLAVREALDQYHADAFVLNLYTGNDFYDMLRVDDRPHFVPGEDGYSIAEPVWYQEQPPSSPPRSRVLYVLRELSDRLGIRRIWVRGRYLTDVALAQGEGPGSVVGYLDDLRRGTSDELAYPQALLAQMLNQQLFFSRFPRSREESIRRVRALLEMVRRENPDRMLILSPIPSYQLVHGEGDDGPLERVVERLPTSYAAGVEQEGELYDSLKGLAQETGWLFVDNLPTLRAHGEGAFNHADFHITDEASALIGRNQAQAALAALGRANE